ncbi:hypothetical protein EGW08_011736 [Elysia chlorotica]|uniref:Uncharacterized protein n=1 Tax=Elysia chlorotica TaxID=188477 RepID=A0A433TG12_ELYCH|nr:hypothetical protein EGW08_011736 [Elysia chlorotica]
MATGIALNMRGATLRVPDNLNVTGRGLSPVRPHSPASPEDSEMLAVANPRPTSTSSDEDDTSSEELTVLDGVRQMNQILVRQIETLRLKIKVDEKNYDQDKALLLKHKENELQHKDIEIEELRESVNARDDQIDHLSRAAEEKDKTIQSKCAEIDELKAMVKKTKEYAQRMNRQVNLARQRREKLESDPLYQQQNEEIAKLTQEVETLRSSLATMEGELKRALTIIDQQNEKLQSMDEERAALHAQFREDLERASKRMRQEVERMREVMRQNYDEMRNLREQNNAMHGDVRVIKDALREMLKPTNADVPFHTLQEDMTRSPNALPAGSQAGANYVRHVHGQPSAVVPKGYGRLVGANISRNSASENRKAYNGGIPSPALRESSQIGIKSLTGRAVGTVGATHQNGVDSSGYYSSSSTARLSVDLPRSRAASTRPPPQTPSYATPKGNNTGSGNNGDRRTFPAICSLKDGVPLSRQPSGQGKSGIRRGSAIARK